MLNTNLIKFYRIILKMKNFFKLNINLTSLELKLVIISFLGLTPFIFGLIDLIINKSNYFFLINIPKVYGVIIFTFLGGIYWGLILNPANSISQSKNLLNFTILWSIMPSILSLVIFTIDASYSLLFLSVGFSFLFPLIPKYTKLQSLINILSIGFSINL